MVELTRTYPMPLHVMVLRYLATFLFRTAIVCGALFLVVLVLGLALEQEVLGLDHEASQGLDRFARTFAGVGALGGVFGVLVLGAVVNDMYRREQRRALEELVEDGTADKDWPPVAWQRPAIGDSHTGVLVLSFFGIVLGPISLLAGLFTFDSGDPGFSFGVIAVSVVMTGASVLGLRSGFRDRTSSAETLWGDKEPARDPREPAHSAVAEGKPRSLRRRELAKAAREQESSQANPGPLATAPQGAWPPALERLERLDVVATKVMGAAMALFGICAAAVILLTIVRKPCRGCAERRFGEGVEGVLGLGLLVAVVLLGVGLVALVLATVLQGWVNLRLRSTIVVMAEDPASEAPPWSLLRRLLLEETPLQALTGHLHTLGITFLAFGATAHLVRDEYPFDEWADSYPALMTLGGVLLLFHLSGWFWKRDATRVQNEALLARWPD